MGNYIQGQPQTTGETTIIKEKSNFIESKFVDMMAKALGKALEDKDFGGKTVEREIIREIMPGAAGSVDMDDFDDSRSLEKIAEAMTVQRGEKGSNFEDLGNVAETEKRADTDKTIDLLSGLD